MDKFDRIYALHGLLSSRRYPVTMAMITDELECTSSTAKRIIKYMREFLDAPIEYQRDHNGYFYDRRSEHSFQLPGLWFNTSELHALLTAQALLERVDPGLYSEQLRPLTDRISHILETAGHDDSEQLQRVRILSLAKRKFDDHVFRQVATAVLQRKRLHLQYTGRSDANVSQRDVSPQRLVHYRDNWYLDAWYSNKAVLMGSALLWCFATRHSAQVMAIVLVKCCNAVAEHHSNARRVGLSASMAALRPLRRTMAIHCEACLALNADRPTEPINTTLLEY